MQGTLNQSLKPSVMSSKAKTFDRRNSTDFAGPFLSLILSVVLSIGLFAAYSPNVKVALTRDRHLVENLAESVFGGHGRRAEHQRAVATTRSPRTTTTHQARQASRVPAVPSHAPAEESHAAEATLGASAAGDPAHAAAASTLAPTSTSVEGAETGRPPTAAATEPGDMHQAEEAPPAEEASMEVTDTTACVACDSS